MGILCLFVPRHLLFHCQNIPDDREPSRDRHCSLPAGQVPSNSPVLILNWISTRLALWTPLGCQSKCGHVDYNIADPENLQQTRREHKSLLGKHCSVGLEVSHSPTTIAPADMGLLLFTFFYLNQLWSN